MSVVALGALGFDKQRARGGGRRVPEKTLHLLEALGGWPGALVGVRLFRHKSSKPAYLVVLWLIVVLHAAGWGAVWLGWSDT